MPRLPGAEEEKTPGTRPGSLRDLIEASPRRPCTWSVFRRRPTIQRIHDFIHAAGKQLRGKHHEIYLGDRGARAEKLKTIIRQPMA